VGSKFLKSIKKESAKTRVKKNYYKKYKRREKKKLLQKNKKMKEKIEKN